MKLNKFKRVLPHTLRIVTMGVATTVAGIAMASCEKDDALVENEKSQKEQTHTVDKKTNVFTPGDSVVVVTSGDTTIQMKYKHLYVYATPGEEEKWIKKGWPKSDGDSIQDLGYLKKLIDNNIDSVYINVCGDWNMEWMKGGQISTMRQNFFEYPLDVSPRIRGRGNFNFQSGVIYPNDCLWFVRRGWTINGR